MSVHAQWGLFSPVGSVQVQLGLFRYGGVCSCPVGSAQVWWGLIGSGGVSWGVVGSNGVREV